MGLLSSRPMINKLSSVITISKSELKLIVITSMVLEKDSNNLSEREMANGQFSIVIADRLSIEELVNKHTDIILSTYSEKETTSSISTISEALTQWMS
jgi:hypothetical protein